MGLESVQVDPHFWLGKRVFLTGHTGFKGSWLSLWLTSMGAKVCGYSLPPLTIPNLYTILKIDQLVETSVIGDVADFVSLQKAMIFAGPDVVIHMAAQALVRHSYENPIETYSTNVMGTVHLLEAVKAVSSAKAVVIVTTDKCYENKEWIWGYRENEPMGGHDPYSSSKGCAELVVAAYIRSFFSEDEYSIHMHAVATARAGNVIGGGDWSDDRLIPDAVRAFEKNQILKIRNPMATRPWQHVLEPLSGYLVLAQKLFEKGPDYIGAWNLGPKQEDTRSVKDVITRFTEAYSPLAKWEQDTLEQPHEAHFLKLDCTKANQILGWQPRWNLDIAIQNIADWYRAFSMGQDMQLFSLEQIRKYQQNKIN
jgi:CDP-glucose 4,6-dehydratase